MTVARTICLGFLAVATIGTLLLLLPFSSADGHWGDLVTALFTATSAVCVTGLIVVDTGSHFSFFGQLVILALIQVGGLGYMTATTFLLLLLGRRLGLRDKIAIQQSLDKTGMSGVGQLVKSIIAMTLIFELSGTFLLFPVFAADYEMRYALWLSAFHSISAFNNAGFSLFADNLTRYATNVPVNLVIPFLIIFGGIGYQVIMEMYTWVANRVKGRSERGLFSLNFKIVTSTTILLLIVGTVAFFSVEYRNPATIGGMNLSDQLLISWFHSVMPRTAGFNSIDYGQMSTAGLFMTIALMFVGASPGSTGGGMKTTTLRLVFECTKAVLRGKEQVVIYQRQIPVTLLLKAVGVVFGSAMTVVITTIVIAIADPEVDFIQLLFESVSAFATVGLSTGITANVSIFSKLVLIATMYIGRVGVLLSMAAVLGDPSPSSIHYPEENLLVG
ncbi:TrkH family potassium uptake protein [Egbenema bharatensis]|uniref:TrkH family potassium uptake protein n=1 Tax=Egbenema bharatensis TaxID=3463334 RepID=UPI003A877866